MLVEKRNGKTEQFDKTKIIRAVNKAFIEVDGELSAISLHKCEEIANYIEELNKDFTVEEIQDIVEDKLMASNRKDVARSYVRYRYKRELVREGNTTDKSIFELLNGISDYWNSENANKNAKTVTTQRDYLAGITSTDITRRFLLAKDIVEAHDAGIIHFHDADYFGQNVLSNCFSRDTKFITEYGLRRFGDFRDGETVKVKDKDGIWRTATVRNYGKQKMYDVTFSSGRTIHKITCTKNHRWILKDGSVTTNLNIGDSIYLTQDTTHYEPKSFAEKKYFCYGAILADGSDVKTNGVQYAVRIRLCGERKNKYRNLFKETGYTETTSYGDDKEFFSNKEFSKQKFLDYRVWEVLPLELKVALFNGYYMFDGNLDRDSICTADERLLELINDISCLSGYYVVNQKKIKRNTNYKNNAILYNVSFIKSQPTNRAWKVVSIVPHFNISNTSLNAWCVEEPITHSFMLEGGIVTGNCCLINLNDMLQNGTIINGVMIEKPHKLLTACTIATQIILGVSSSQYGGCTISLTHLAPFVRDSYNAFLKKYKDAGVELNKAKELASIDLKKEVEAGVQTFNYQVNSMTNTNGQAPFLSVFMYLGETDEYKEELAMLIEEFLKQRILGFKNEKGVYVTPAFPKLLYVLEEDNIHKDSKYYYLTELAAKCTAKRMVPDYISEKIMKRDKINARGEGECYACMGCVDGKEVITYKYNNNVYTESFERMWDRLSKYFDISLQPNNKDFVMKTPGVMIYDQKEGFVENYGVIKNHNANWLQITFSNGRTITCTVDHPFETVDGRIVEAGQLQESDLIEIDKLSNLNISDLYSMNADRAWLYGVALCDATYDNNIVVSIAAEGEDEIEENFTKIMKREYTLDVNVINRYRGAKGNYKDIRVVSNNDDTYIKLRTELIGAFEGKAKNHRHIPNEVFSWNKDARLAFLAGMIDADGHLNTTMKKASIQIGSTNKELAIQQAMLAQTCGMTAKIYLNHYASNNQNKIRYRVEFTPTIELLSFVKCNKKKDLSNSVLESTNNSISNKNTCYITDIKHIIKEGFSYDVTTSSSHFTVSGLYSHNCRSFLTPDRLQTNLSKAKDYDATKGKYYGRFNGGVVTINLPDVALSSKRNYEDFWKIFDERLELCHRALQTRYKRLSKGVSDMAPIMWQNGALARLDKGESIDKLLKNGYATFSLGFAGLYECVKYMTGHSHTDEAEGEKFAFKVMNKLNDACKRWKEEENIDYSVYGTPIESTTAKFATKLKERFGKDIFVEMDGKDRNYITNSYHVFVNEEIDPFTKLSLESKFQKLSPGGAVSYIECADLTQNTEAVIEVIKFIYDNIMYAELNTKSDYCQECGYDGEIKIIDKDGKLDWQCPNCGNEDHNKMNVARRTCG